MRLFVSVTFISVLCIGPGEKMAAFGTRVIPDLKWRQRSRLRVAVVAQLTFS